MAQIEIRAARAEDRAAVLAFCEHTWEWGDYIPYVWNDWLQNPDGKLFVATSEGVPVGVSHLLMVSALDAWLEGVRVDARYRQQGIASSLNITMMAEAMQRGATHARFLTESTNTGSIRVAEHVHMRQVGGFVPFTANALPASPQRTYGIDSTQLATPDDIDEIIDYLNASNVFPAVGGLYYVGFTAYVITAELLAEKVAAQQVYLLRRWNRLDGLAIAEPRTERNGKRLSLGYIDGMTIESISLIAYDLRRRLTTSGLESIYAYAPDLVLVRDGLIGIEYEWNGSVFYTFERSLL